VTRFLLWRPHTSISDSDAHIEQSLVKWESGSAYTWFLFSRATDELIGSIAARPNGNEVELGYVLAKKFWGRGLMLEAILAIVDWAFSRPTVTTVLALCDVDNVASARLLEKAGFRLEQRRDRWSIHPNISDLPRDCYAYVKTRSEPADTLTAKKVSDNVAGLL
jgi:RimJ/RimL family protein N-acetyltransferase